MAKVVDHIPAKGFIGRKTYPWNKWMDGRIWELRQGKDFKVKPMNFSQQVYMQAARLKVKAHTAIRGNRVYVHAESQTNGKGNAATKGKRN